MKMKGLWVGLIVGLIGFSAVRCEESPIEKALARDFQTFIDTGRVGKILKNVATELDLKNLFLKSETSAKWSEQKVSLFCSTCAAGINQILKLDDPSVIVNQTIELCISLGFTSAHVCKELVLTNQDDMLYILENTPDETGNDICGVIFVGKGCTTRDPKRVWEVTLPDTAKPPIDNTPYPQPGRPTLKVLHLADTHYDPLYTPGSSITCDDVYLCCRDNGITKTANDSAGFWGSYGRCDIPRRTLEHIFDHVATNHADIDFIIWTGDIIPHSVWENQKDANLALIHDTANLIAKYFPGIPVYPAVGNHEGVPVNQFPQPYITVPEFDISWLYDELKVVWGTWLPEEAAETVAYSAYYSVLIKPGLRILSINTNYCYGLNWWLVYDSSDIAQELARVVEELQKAEDAGENVYIIGHIPPGHRDCEFTWSHEFNRIASRYENTISGLFFAHTHKDQFEILFDPDNPDRPYEVAYIGPSQTTYHDLNPGYRLYTVEGTYNESQFRVLDHETWIMDLNSANALNETNLFRLYSAKEEYGLRDLSASSWFELVKEMIQPDSNTFSTYYRILGDGSSSEPKYTILVAISYSMNYAKAAPPRLVEGCDDDCKSSLLCDALTSDNSDHSICEQLIYNK